MTCGMNNESDFNCTDDAVNWISLWCDLCGWPDIRYQEQICWKLSLHCMVRLKRGSYVWNFNCTLHEIDVFAEDRYIFVIQMQRMERIALAYNVELKIQQWTGCIILDGLHHACYDCVHEISNALRDIDRKRQQKQAAAMLANMIQWCYLEVTWYLYFPHNEKQKQQCTNMLSFANCLSCNNRLVHSCYLTQIPTAFFGAYFIAGEMETIFCHPGDKPCLSSVQLMGEKHVNCVCWNTQTMGACCPAEIMKFSSSSGMNMTTMKQMFYTFTVTSII